MITSRASVSVRYAETDMMGVVYHGSYLPWLEIGRTTLLKEHGLPYRELEAEGFFLPVLEVGLRYLRPAKYDDTINITTFLREKPTLRIRMEYELHRGDELLANIANPSPITTHGVTAPGSVTDTGFVPVTGYNNRGTVTKSRRQSAICPVAVQQRA